MTRKYTRVDAHGVPMIVQKVWYNPSNLVFVARLFDGSAVTVERERIYIRHDISMRAPTRDEWALAAAWFDARTFKELTNPEAEPIYTDDQVKRIENRVKALAQGLPEDFYE